MAKNPRGLLRQQPGGDCEAVGAFGADHAIVLEQAGAGQSLEVL